MGKVDQNMDYNFLKPHLEWFKNVSKENEVKIYPQGGHWLTSQYPQEATQDILTFFK